MAFDKEDKIISEFLHSIGPWSDHIAIGGGYALMIYKFYLADPKLENFPVGTRDIDSLISRRVPDISEKNIAKRLHEAGFKQFFKDHNQPATEAYVKEINGFEIEIEFLTDSSARINKTHNVVIAGVVAQPLSYLTLSLQTTLEFQTLSGKPGKVVSPGAWMFHKGLTFPRRKSSLKIHKDLYGIWYVASQLGDFSEKALVELSMLLQKHPKWFKTFQRNLRKWISSTTPIDWSKLESQDPSGNLEKTKFEEIVKKMTQKPS